MLPCVGPQLGGDPLQKELTLSDGVPAQGPQVGARHRDHGVGHALVSRPVKCGEEERREAAEEWRGGVKRGHFLREKGRRSWEEKPRRRDNRDGAATTRLGGTEKEEEEGKRVAIVLYIPLENRTSGAGLEFFLPSFSLRPPPPNPHSSVNTSTHGAGLWIFVFFTATTAVTAAALFTWGKAKVNL